MECYLVTEVSWILEAETASFFDSIDRTKLKKLAAADSRSLSAEAHR
jgi:hypothetical protein